MAAFTPTNRIALNFLPLKAQDFSYQIYRKELGQKDVAVPGTHKLPRDLSPIDRETKSGALQWTRYAISMERIEGYEQVTLRAWISPDLTVDVLHRGLEVRCKAPDLAGHTENPDREFTRKIFFVLKRHEEGSREGIWARAYGLKTIGRFGFLIDFSLLVPQDASISDKKRLELSLTHKNGRLNEDFYLDHYEKVEEFLRRYYPSIQRITLHDGTEVEIERKLPLIRSFNLSKRIYIFGGNKEGKSPFFGLRNHGPLQAAPGDTRVVFVFSPFDRSRSQDLFRALRGDTYSTFPGMEQMFGVHFDGRNVSGIEVSGFTQADIQVATAASRSQYPNKKIIPVVLVPMSKHSSEDETRAYFRAKHAFLSEKLPSQFVDRKRLEDRAALQWSISNIGLALFAKMGGIPWRMKPSTEKCLVVGIGQAHRIVSGRIDRYFAYSVLADSSGIYESIKLLGNSTDPDVYLTSLTDNLRDVLLAHKDKYSSFVLHLTFSMKKREIDAIKNVLKELKGQATNNEFIVLKFNDKNDFFGFSAEHNSRVPYEGCVVPLSRKEFLLWFSGLRLEDSKVPTKPERPVHIKVLYPEETLPETDLRRVLQDSVNIAGANWRGFNAKSIPISVYYAKLVADYFAHFGEDNLPDVNLEGLSPWFL